MIEYGRISSHNDFEAFGRIAQQVFNFPSSMWDIWKQRVHQDDHRVVRSNGEIVGGLGYYPIHQWFGGRAVSMAALALVCIDPTCRGKGIAKSLLTSTLLELRQHGFAISTLFASSQQVYRRLGYEQAGTANHMQHSLLPAARPQAAHDIHEVYPLQSSAFAALAERRARRTEGNLQRNEGMWQRLFDARENVTPVRGFLVGPSSSPEGYVIYLQQPGVRIAADRLVIKDMTAETPEAATAIWNFLYGHRSTVESLQWCGAAEDSCLLLPTEYAPELVLAQRWMLRLLNVPAALEQRGYRTDASLVLEMDIEDPLLEENSGRLTLSVEGGAATVTPGGRGRFRASILGLAALFSGMFTADALRVAGLIDTNENDEAIANQLFSGGPPWMADKF